MRWSADSGCTRTAARWVPCCSACTTPQENCTSSVIYSGFSDAEATDLLPRLRALEAPTGFGEHARRPGAQSRWTGDKDLDWVPLRPELVLQVSYDQLTGDRFRHATRFERWRPDKDPSQCTLDQLERPEGPRFNEVVAAGSEG